MVLCKKATAQSHGSTAHHHSKALNDTNEMVADGMARDTREEVVGGEMGKTAL